MWLTTVNTKLLPLFTEQKSLNQLVLFLRIIDSSTSIIDTQTRLLKGWDHHLNTMAHTRGYCRAFDCREPLVVTQAPQLFLEPVPQPLPIACLNIKRNTHVLVCWVPYTAGCNAILPWCSTGDILLTRHKQKQVGCICAAKYVLLYLHYSQEHDSSVL